MALSMPALAIPRPPRADSVQQALPSLLRLRRNRDTSVTGRKGGGHTGQAGGTLRHERRLSLGPAEQPESRDDRLGYCSPRPRRGSFQRHHFRARLGHRPLRVMQKLGPGPEV